jgi:hypothetical protein
MVLYKNEASLLPSSYPLQKWITRSEETSSSQLSKVMHLASLPEENKLGFQEMVSIHPSSTYLYQVTWWKQKNKLPVQLK